MGSTRPAINQGAAGSRIRDAPEEAADQAFSAYALDFGLLASGDTALVELNDGFSLGLYSLAPARYTDLIVTRWAELIQSAEA